MKKLIIPAFIVVLFIYLSKKPAVKFISKTIDPAFEKKNNFHVIPDGKNNYRSAQMSLEDLQKVIKNYGIKTVVRMNGNGADTHTGISIESEKDLCKLLGCNFVFLNAHEGYFKGKGYLQSITKANKLLNAGNTLIHCNWGADRTGFIVGAYLKNAGIITDPEALWNYTIQFNSWNYYIKKGAFKPYFKYAEAILPPNLLNQKVNK